MCVSVCVLVGVKCVKKMCKNKERENPYEKKQRLRVLIVCIHLMQRKTRKTTPI